MCIRTRVDSLFGGETTGGADTTNLRLSTLQGAFLASSSTLAPRITPAVMPIGSRVVVWCGRALHGPQAFNEGAIDERADFDRASRCCAQSLPGSVLTHDTRGDKCSARLAR